MATATKPKKAKADKPAKPAMPVRPADAVRVSLPGQPKADVTNMGDGRYRVSYPAPQTFWAEGGVPEPVEVEARSETDAYNRAGGITGHDRPHTVED